MRLLGVDPGSLELKHTIESVKGIIQQSASGGTLDPGEAVMLGGVVRLHEQQAREVRELRVESVRENRVVAVRIHAVTGAHPLPVPPAEQ